MLFDETLLDLSNIVVRSLTCAVLSARLNSVIYQSLHFLAEMILFDGLTAASMLQRCTGEKVKTRFLKYRMSGIYAESTFQEYAPAALGLNFMAPNLFQWLYES